MLVFQVFKTGNVSVQRVEALYDLDSHLTGFLNPHMHGLGPTGWTSWPDKKNPINCIRFVRNGRGNSIIFSNMNI